LNKEIGALNQIRETFKMEDERITKNWTMDWPLPLSVKKIISTMRTWLETSLLVIVVAGLIITLVLSVSLLNLAFIGVKATLSMIRGVVFPHWKNNSESDMIRLYKTS